LFQRFAVVGITSHGGMQSREDLAATCAESHRRLPRLLEPAGRNTALALAIAAL
jgi:mannose-1-phosphate guanylyltransferase